MLKHQLDIIREAVKLTLMTGRVVDCDRTSLLLCAPMDAGKTMEVLVPFEETPGVHWTTNDTGYGLVKFLFSKDRRYRDVHHIIFPDLTVPLLRSRSVVNDFEGLLQALMWEGVKDMHSFHLNVTLPARVRIGLVAAITPEILKLRVRQWAKTGLVRRFIPLSYTYCEQSRGEIKKKIERMTHHQVQPIPLDGRRSEIHVAWRSELARPISQLADRVLHSLAEEPTKLPTDSMMGFSFQLGLQNLVMAHAACRGAYLIDREDIDAILALEPYLNYKCTPI